MGWLYQAPKSRSKVVAVWGVLVKLVGGRVNTANLYSYQNCLPRMRVPPLKATVKKFIDSVKPVLEKEEFQTMEAEAEKVKHPVCIGEHFYEGRNIYRIPYFSSEQLCTICFSAHSF